MINMIHRHDIRVHYTFHITSPLGILGLGQGSLITLGNGDPLELSRHPICEVMQSPVPAVLPSTVTTA